MNAQQAHLTKFLQGEQLSCLSTQWVDRRPQRYLARFAWHQGRWTHRSRSLKTSMTLFAAVVLTFLLLLEVAGRLIV